MPDAVRIIVEAPISVVNPDPQILAEVLRDVDNRVRTTAMTHNIGEFNITHEFFTPWVWNG